MVASGGVWRLLSVACCFLPQAHALVGAQKLAESSAPAPAQRLPPPEISFQLDYEEPQVDEADKWRDLAQRAASLHQLECHEDLLGATSSMVDAAEKGDSLAMAALGAMCKPRYLVETSCQLAFSNPRNL